MISINLDKIGLDGCFLASNNGEITGILPSYEDLRSMKKVDEYYVLSKPLANNTSPSYIIYNQISGGTYGRIYQAMRNCFNGKISEFVNIIIKEIEIHVQESDEIKYGKEKAISNTIQSNMYEYVIHALVKQMFESLGIGSLIPTLYEISARIYGDSIKKPSDIMTINMAMEYINGYTLFDYFKAYLTKIQNAAFHDHIPTSIINARIRNENILVDILVQLACYLDILQTNLRFNHRDLNINNILVRKNIKDRLCSYVRIISHPSLLTPYECKTDIVIIDYGFSCLACSDSDMSCLEAGSYFKNEFSCLKKGRDIALFIYSINTIFPFVHLVSAKFYEFLKSIMIAVDNEGKTYNLLNGFDSKGNVIDGEVITDKTKFDEKIYLFLRQEKIEVPNCDPINLLLNLQKYGYVL